MDSSERKISFRSLVPADVSNLVRWQRDADVARWWWDIADLTDEELTEKWTRRASGPNTGEDSKTDRLIIVVDGHDIGEIQVADLDDYPEVATEVGIPNAASVDIFVGEPEWRNRGVGSAVIRQFVDEVVFSRPGIETCTIDPEPENTRAIRSYEKAGFTHVRTYRSGLVEVGIDVYLMRRDRPSG